MINKFDFYSPLICLGLIHYNPNHRDAIATDPKLAFFSAVYFWNENKIYLKATPDNVEGVTAKVNSAKKGLLDRAIAYYRIKNPQLTRQKLMEEANRLRPENGRKEDLGFVRKQIRKVEKVFKDNQEQAQGIFKNFTGRNNEATSAYNTSNVYRV